MDPVHVGNLIEDAKNIGRIGGGLEVVSTCSGINSTTVWVHTAGPLGPQRLVFSLIFLIYLLIVHSMGNPQVIFSVPGPLPIKTCCSSVNVPR